MQLTINQDFTDLNTFGISAVADYAYTITSKEDIQDIVHQDLKNAIVLGGGSNILLTEAQISRPIIINRIPGIEVLKESEDEVIVKVGAGVNWHDFILWTVEQNYSGLENLSLIPGNVGAAPIQNIGAYGVEQEQRFEQLSVSSIETGESRFFDHAQCEFGYRDSVFKRSEKGKWIITSVQYRLSKTYQPILGYKDVISRVDELGGNPTMKQVSDVIIDIRSRKLPYPDEIGNAGSFFKNPVIPADQYTALLVAHPETVGYPLPSGAVKLAAAWLIDQCGFKGYRKGNVGSYKNQALVVVNYGGATGNEIWEYAQEVQQTVLDKFGVKIVPEVNVI